MRVRWVLLFLLAIMTAPVLIVFAAYARWRWEGGFPPESDPLPLRWRCRAMAREVGALALTLAGVLRRIPPSGHARQPSTNEPGILFIADSVLGLAAQTALERRLRARGWSTSMFRPSSWWLSPADAARELDAVLRSRGTRPGTVLIAFGSAGLLLRYFLRRYRASGIRRVVTIGTAHQAGHSLLNTASASLIGQLSAGDRVPQQFEFIAIASDFDACVAPATRAYYPGAFNIEVRGMGHFTLVRSSRVVDLIVENLGSGRGAIPSRN